MVLTKFIVHFASPRLIQTHNLILNQNGEKVVHEITFELETIEKSSSNFVEHYAN